MLEDLNYWLQQYDNLIVFVGLWLDSILAAAPGETLLIFTAFYAGVNKQTAWPLYLFGVLGAWLGSYTSYLIGMKLRKSKWNLLPKMGVTQGRVDKVSKLMERYGLWVLLLARFIPGSRQVVYYLAGLGKMPVLKFHLATLGGIFPWVGLAVYAGLVVQGQWQQALKMFRNYGYITGFAVAILLAAYVVWARIFRNKTPDEG